MKETKRPGQQLKGLSVQELLGVTNEESAMEIELRLIHPFKDHPFKVVDDDKMQDLVDSIKMNGVLSPVLLREAERGHYEMISGHRRMHAAELVGLETMISILNENLKGRLPAVKVNLTEKKLRKYFPASYSSEDMESVIIALLEGWKQSRGGE